MGRKYIRDKGMDFVNHYNTSLGALDGEFTAGKKLGE